MWIEDDKDFFLLFGKTCRAKREKESGAWNRLPKI